MMLIKKLRAYISAADLFLKEYRATHRKLTTSQQAEIQKHQRLAKLRDQKS